MAIVTVNAPQPPNSKAKLIEPCLGCGRSLSNARSVVHGYGPRCWQKHLDDLPDERRGVEEMKGYNYFRTGAGVFTVVSPEHNAYTVDLVASTCDCVAFEASDRTGCKHLDYARRETEAGEDTRAPIILCGDSATVTEAGTRYRVNWRHPRCSCKHFQSTGEICEHILLAQAAAAAKFRAAHRSNAEIETNMASDFAA